MRHRSPRNTGPLPTVKRRPTTNPILPVAAMGEAIEFYESLGFEVTRYDDHYAWVRHCNWEWSHLRRVDSVAGNQASADFHVEDAAAWRSAFIAASGGSVELQPVEATPWGKNEFSFTDPAGNLIRLGSPS